MKYRAILKDDEEINERKAEREPICSGKLVMLLLWIIVNIFAYLYISKSNTIYFWDNATYWDISRKLANSSFENFLKTVYDSIGIMDYNYVAGIISSFLVRLFGESRMCYILGLVNMYLLPSFALVYALAKRLGKSPQITMVTIFLICPAITYIAFLGFVDIGGLLICMSVYALYYAKNADKNVILRHIGIGVLLVLMMLWRRWYAFFAVSFLTAMVCDCLLSGKRKLPVILTAFTSGIILLVGFYPFLTGILLRDYGNLYEGYKFSISTDMKLITRYFGFLPILGVFIASLWQIVMKREFRLLFMWTQIIVCFLMFAFTQTHGQQHLLLYVPSLIMILIILVKNITKTKTMIFVVILSVLQTVSVFVPRVQPQSLGEIKYYSPVPSFSVMPVVREDTQQILELKNRLDKIIEKDKTLGVISSSFKMNEDILKNVQPSLGKKATRPDYIVSLPQVDSRDTDMTTFYNVNYILVATPVQTHLAKGNQRVVEEAVKSFEAYADFAMSYKEMPEHETVIDGITLKLYKRIREVKEAAMREFELRLVK